MGVIGPALFDDDTAADVRGTYRAYIEQGIDDKEALRRILEQYQGWFGGENGVGALVGFAVTQFELGRLDSEIRDQAIAAIDRGGDLHLYPRDVDQRRAVLAEARAILSAPQPARAHLQVPSPQISDLVAGDVLALDVPSGLVIFRVVRVNAVPTHEVPVLEQLEYSGSAEPPLDLLERLPKRDFPNPTFKDLGHCHIVVPTNPGEWKQMGFRKIGRIQAREADSRRGGVYRTSRVSWSLILAYYRNSPNQVTVK
jgi:hypothetical protein